MASPAGPLQKAITDALDGVAGLGAMLGPDKYFSGEASQSAIAVLLNPQITTPKSYIILGNSSENSQNFFALPGRIVTETMHIYTDRTRGKMRVLEIYSKMDDGLNEKSIPLTGFFMLRGTTNLVTVLADPTGAFHGIVSYEAMVVNA